jgi:rubrerythrin
MAGLNGSKSFENLKEAFAGEAQANRRYLYFARVADIERNRVDVSLPSQR